MRDWFAEQLAWAGIEPAVRLTGPSDRIMARLHESEDAVFLWLVSHDRESPHLVAAQLAPRYGVFTSVDVLWGDEPVALIAGNRISVKVPPQDAVVVRLRR